MNRIPIGVDVFQVNHSSPFLLGAHPSTNRRTNTSHFVHGERSSLVNPGRVASNIPQLTVLTLHSTKTQLLNCKLQYRRYTPYYILYISITCSHRIFLDVFRAPCTRRLPSLWVSRVLSPRQRANGVAAPPRRSVRRLRARPIAAIPNNNGLQTKRVPRMPTQLG